ncbi:putative SWI/SNF-related matrix-associated actin-dependent regulator of chromatin subfamily A member 3-like 1 [Gastrolobium bilobum]|uniref:putative SWI/SNF-related matrix-associated actin-dependent regulator of chromatin subfamily A member 3-like 1 n=1 Tax=Gastrolobium bilobum TaxID=150636 RepID=UPI002AAFFB68|nr:putative SWI/SNF-related matrix-associated actin-dependent regulator of chromatin subfamily A member 3-like 1 [Gastrolobium bilobum]
MHSEQQQQEEEEEQGSPLSPSDTYLVGFINASIVGIKHYSATITGREMVGLVREPFNDHDENAIKVINTRTDQVGYIDRSTAAVLSPLIDTNLVIVEGIIPKSRSAANKFRIPCQVHVFAYSRDFPTVKSAILRGGLHLITEYEASFTLSESVAVKETRAGKRIKTEDAIFNLVDENLASNKRVLQALEPPRSVITTELLEHQKEGLGWLVHRENSDELPPFWEESDGKFVNVLTNYQTDSRPEPLRGGIFNDAMGLGKTLTLLSLIAFDKRDEMGHKQREGLLVMSKKKKRANEIATGSRKRMFFGDSETSSTDMGRKTTLVVCPPSVMSTWSTQILEHTEKRSLKTYIYYGDKRTKSPEELLMYDIVLTTYPTLASEERELETAVKQVDWWRIILDEAHTIKNTNAGQTRAVIELNAKRKWAVTGTPIQNGSYDLFSLMGFLRFQPFSDRVYWRTLVQRPLNTAKKRGLTRLQVLMAAISLRRTKEKGLVGLPPKAIETCYVELSREEREMYDEVKEESKLRMIDYCHNDCLVNHYSTVLSMILRLRQICTHLALCPSDLKSVFSSYRTEDVTNNPELLKKLVGVLQDGDFDCPICMSPPSDIVITCCAHIFCRDCILRTLKTSDSCPLCRRTLSEPDLFSAPSESSEVDNSSESCSSQKRLSSKASALIKLLTETRDQHPAAKSVVFSQFRKMLLFLEVPLKAAGFKILRLDGTMNATHRASVIEKFQASGRDEPMVLLASLRASSTGINLTAASRVYFMEPWWNAAVEEQATDRVHRIGQKEPVKIVRLIAQNSIEEKILMLQEKKKDLERETSRRGSKDDGMGMGMGIGMDDLRFLLED